MSLTIIYQSVQSFLTQHMVLSPFIYLILHVIFAICIIPCSPMAVIAGALWGKWLGLGISMTSAFLSSCATFGLSRFFLRKKVYHFLSKRYAKTDWFLAQTQKQGWKFVATIQLNPAAPGSTLGYLFGLSNIEFPVYAFFLILFMLPLQLVLVICGDVFPALLMGKMIWILAFILLFLLVYLIYRLNDERKLQ